MKKNQPEGTEMTELREKTGDDADHSEHQSTSWFMAGLMLANTAMGLGLLNYPYAFNLAGGVLAALVIQTLCIVPVGVGLLALGKASILTSDTAYQDIVHRHCGAIALVFCNIIAFLNNFGVCIVFLISLADQIDETLLFCFGRGFCDHWFLRRNVTMPVISCLFILPWCFMQHLNGRAIKCLSVLGIVTTCYIMFMVMFKYYESEEIQATEKRTSNFVDMLRAVPTMFYSFDAHVEAVPLYACLKKKSMTEISKVLTLGLTLSLFVYSVVGMYGYLGTKGHVNSDILLSYYPPDVTVIIGTALMGVKAISSYPVIFFCIRVILDDLMLPHYKSYGGSETTMVRAHTIVLFVTSVGISITVPSIGHVIMLIGGFSAVIMLVFPGLCLIRLSMNNSREVLQAAIGVIMVVGGAFFATVMTLQNTMDFTKTSYINEFACTN